ncbi:MAG: hypothetical protein GYA14_11770 [Ignavibacteria bacterium]|nr:hypothetical protein [Ignavibacteria bacterium]
MDFKAEINQAVQNRDEEKFYQLNSLMIYGKPFPKFALEWCINLPQLAKKENKILVIEAPRNHLKTTAITIFKAFYFLLTNPLSEVWLFSYSIHQAREFIGRLKNIVEYYYPEIIKQDSWNKQELGFINGSSYKLGSITSTYYGVHPDLIICDDILGGEGDPQKIIKSNLPPGFVEERFFSMIVPMLSPDSQLIVVGIPFFVGDLYSKLEKMSSDGEAYMIKKYPAVDGNKVLWEERSYDWLMQQKKKIGSQRFAREYLLRPFDAETSLISSSVLEQCLNYDFPMQHNRMFNDSIVVIGADFSISAHIGSDYCVFVALELKDNKIYFLGYDKFKEADYQTQLDRLQNFYNQYDADLIATESVSFQKIYSQGLGDRLLPIYEHKTHNEKNTFNIGIPSLKLYFERQQVILPAGDEDSREMIEDFIKEMQGFVYINGKVIHIGQHDDIAMSFYLGIQGLRSITSLDIPRERESFNEVISNPEEEQIWRMM